ncbi:MAG: DnaJ domain-containing protein [Deltaproteobacteria bacterium]|nr:DnaJ domain-containing protein [Deltaproteobacteria bacterium]
MPKVAGGVDFRSLALSATEGFVLSRVDGTTSVADLCQVTGLGEPATMAALERLVEVRAIHLGEAAPAARQAAPAAQGAAPDPPPAPADGPRYDPKELDEPDVELEPDRRKRILDLFYALPDMNFYDLLGVEPKAERKQIREAYFAKSKEFHPDTLYRRKIGTFKEKLEVIFRSLTQAYDVLTSKNQRVDYDAYIAEQIKSREIERQMREAEAEAERMERELVESVRRARRQAKTRRAAEARRRAVLAQKLAGLSGRMIVRPEAAAAPRPKRSAAETAAEVRKLLSGSSQVERMVKAKGHVEAARAALERQEHVAAANAFRLAMTLDPRNKEWADEFAKASALAARDLAEGYAKQGRYEEQLGHFDLACEHYCKAAEGNPENVPWAERAAAMLVLVKGDLHKAQELGTRAVLRSPKDVQCRLTLAKVFLEAELPKNARREIEAAIEIDPKNDEALELAKLVKKKL